MKKLLLTSIVAGLSSQTEAAEFIVDMSSDNGTGQSQGTLSWAIQQANNNPGSDVITLSVDVSVQGVMQRLIDSDVSIQGSQGSRVIDGNGSYRPLFIKSGQVVIENIIITNGLAKGGNGPGAGAGLGGAIFLYAGHLQLNNVTIENSMAEGGQSTSNSFDYEDGGGGMLGSVNGQAGGGLLAGYVNSTYQNNDPRFGLGSSNSSQIAGFGGGGAGLGLFVTGSATPGSFGGGGGSCYCAYGGTAGRGGFGGGGGNNYYSGRASGGFGSNNGDGAGLGGGVFVRSGSLDMRGVTFTGNQAAADIAASGLGGGLFVLHTLNNSNGNQLGMPAALPEVNACEVVFSNNLASSDQGSSNNNDDWFDEANLINQDSGLPMSTVCFDDVIFTSGFD